ncbi:ABC transporter ATP-binding protein [Dyella monticola]|uniref:ABC transporter ATP-binding protein n=1 Tax=Dyella monticola TaxID=1927958 RepID=A0A370X396_9GAMM|nr:ABC transporter ATP-binding protein [Dyella monticola]RDS82767.1 ABC transporter ATP-binding protein [Dyella monticola]
MNVLIELSQLNKSYGSGETAVNVLKDINLRVAEGEFIALMGPSGSGKTTLLNLIGGIDRPSGGRIRFRAQSLEALSDAALGRWRSAHVGFVFQSYNLLPSLSALANVEVPLMLTALNRSERLRRSRTALDLVGLSERANHKPRQLSGGQQQRVAIARAIVGGPSLLICDEPTGNLDREAADEILALLAELRGVNGVTLVMVTHDPKAAAYADRVVVLDKGSVDEPVLRVA